MNQALEEAVCDLQAQVYVLREALRTLARTHPEPDALLAAWREAQRAPGTAGPIAPTYPRRSDYLAERCSTFAKDWAAELVELAITNDGNKPPPASP